MSAKVIKFLQTFEDEFSKYEQAITKNDYFLACSYFNSLKKYNRPEVFVLQTVVYSILKRPILENQCLIKLLTFENFTNYNIPFAIKSMSNFFKFFSGNEVEEHYIELAGKRMEKSNQQFGQSKNIQGKMPSLRFVDDINSAEVILKAKSLLVRNEFEEAVKLLQSVPKSDKNYIQALNMQAYAYIYSGKKEQANEIVDEIIKFDPDNFEVLLSIVLLTSGDSDKYKQIKDKILAKTDASLNFNIYKSETLIKENRFEEALSCLLSIKKPECYYEHVLFNLARCYYFLGDNENTIVYLKKLYLTDNTNYFLKRYIRLLESGAKLPKGDLSVALNSIISRQLTNRLVELLKLPLDEFVRQDMGELDDCLRWSMTLKNKDSMMLMCDKLTAFKVGIELIEDKLIELNLQDAKTYLLLVALMKNIYRGEVFVLLNSKLQKVKLKYPSKLLSEFNIGENGWTGDSGVNISTFAQAYAESYVYMIYNDLPISSAAKTGDRLFAKISNLAPLHREVFENINLLSAVMVVMNFSEDANIIKMAASDFFVSMQAINRTLQLLEEN